jgi:uncharacterized repeat protein (TIGR01451 family)
MGPKGRRVCLALLLMLSVGPLPGCFGITANPSYFPHLCPPGDIIQTHAKPPGWSYFSNFDPCAVALEVRPLDATNPVRTQHVLIATVLDKDGNTLRGRRVEWILEGTAGNIVEVDESGCWPGRGYKDGLKHAVSYTNYFEHTITRGNCNPSDDFTVRPGQTWCVVTSAVEGDTHITCYAPGVFDWDKGRVFVSCKWVDANWQFPPTALVPAGSEHVLTTRVFRHTDKQPLANYRVRYTILDEEPQVVFKQTRTREVTAVSDLTGSANATLVQVVPRPGVTRIAVEIVRPPDPTSPSGVGISLARGETAVEWLAPAIALNHTGPPTAGRDTEITYTTTISNGGKSESRSMFVTQPLPDGLQYLRSQPQAVVDGKQLVWTLGQLLPGQTHMVQSTYKVVRQGSITCCASVTTEEGLRDTKCVKTDVTEPRLRVTMTGPPTGQVGVPFSYQIAVINEGGSPLNNVVVDASFDAALQHKDKTTRMQADLGTMNPGQTYNLPALTLTPAAAGRFTTRVQVKADGGLMDQAEQTITVSQANLGIKLVGPAKSYAGWPAEWQIRVSNDGDVPLSDVQVRNALPPEVKALKWTGGGQPASGEVLWNVGNLAPREQKTLEVTIVGDKLTTGAVNKVSATAGPGLTATDQVSFDILGLPGLHMDVGIKEQPVLTGKTVKYAINVTNTGAAPATQIEIKATLPPELQPALAGTKGPTVPRIDGQVVTFGRLESLAAQQKATYEVEALALRPGDVRVRVELRSASLSNPQPVVEEQATRIVKAPP